MCICCIRMRLFCTSKNFVRCVVSPTGKLIFRNLCLSCCVVPCWRIPFQTRCSIVYESEKVVTYVIFLKYYKAFGRVVLHATGAFVSGEKAVTRFAEWHHIEKSNITAAWAVDREFEI